jgi:nitrogen regulatory protein PII
MTKDRSFNEIRSPLSLDLNFLNCENCSGFRYSNFEFSIAASSGACRSNFVEEPLQPRQCFSGVFAPGGLARVFSNRWVNHENGHAYIRTECAAEVMRDLYNAGVGGITCYRVHGIRSEKPTFLYSTRSFEIHHLPASLKLEVVCPDEGCDEIVRLIALEARTGNRGGGITAVLDVDKVQRIRELEAAS